ncbi:MAG: hypothetical protein CM1200mP5_3510 [Candidatus Pelagibacterales bacterium]|nr:MAG: hypothetical protein CM1200mP5_3510 [Pelagibacterales bacterium]
MEKIVKQIQLLTLVIILISTVIAIGSELYQMFKINRVTLADLLLLFFYLEVLAMVRVFWESQSIQITLPLFIAITALSRFIILQGKSINPEILVYEAGAILLIALAILVLRFRNSPIVGLDKKKKKLQKNNEVKLDYFCNWMDVFQSSWVGFLFLFWFFY